MLAVMLALVSGNVEIKCDYSQTGLIKMEKWVSKRLVVMRGMWPIQKHHQGGSGAQGRFPLSFEECFCGIYASLNTIFCDGGKEGMAEKGETAGDS